MKYKGSFLICYHNNNDGDIIADVFERGVKLGRVTTEGFVPEEGVTEQQLKGHVDFAAAVIKDMRPETIHECPRCQEPTMNHTLTESFCSSCQYPTSL